MKVLEGKGIYISSQRIHKNICIGWYTYRTYGTAFYLKIVLAVEHKVV